MSRYLDERGAEAARRTPLPDVSTADLADLSRQASAHWKVGAARTRLRRRADTAPTGPLRPPPPRAGVAPDATKLLRLPRRNPWLEDALCVTAVLAALVFGSIVLNYTWGLLTG